MQSDTNVLSLEAKSFKAANALNEFVGKTQAETRTKYVVQEHAQLSCVFPLIGNFSNKASVRRLFIKTLQNKLQYFLK